LEEGVGLALGVDALGLEGDLPVEGLL